MLDILSFQYSKEVDAPTPSRPEVTPLATTFVRIEVVVSTRRVNGPHSFRILVIIAGSQHSFGENKLLDSYIRFDIFFFHNSFLLCFVSTDGCHPWTLINPYLKDYLLAIDDVEVTLSGLEYATALQVVDDVGLFFLIEVANV